MDYLYIYFSGILSFLTPCILPILPFFISSTLGVNRTFISKKELLLRTLMFCLGFTIVLSSLGAGINFLSSNANKFFVQIIAANIMLIFSLYYLQIIDIPFFNKNINIDKKNFTKSNYINSLILGLLFSITWSPCLSPIMGTVLSYIATKESSIFASIIKMLSFSIGIATPLIIATFFWNNISKFFKKNQNLPLIIKKVLGTLVLIFSLNLLYSSTTGLKSCPHDEHNHGALSSSAHDNNESKHKKSYDQNTIVMIYSIDCYYCDLANDIMKKINNNCPHIKLNYIDISNPDTYFILDGINIMGTPSFLFYSKNNKLLDSVSGYLEEKHFIKHVNKTFNTNCKI